MRDALLGPLRGVAALWVLTHHLTLAYAPSADEVPLLFRLGYFGVPMFFVVSGYCLAAAGRRAVRVGEPPIHFLTRRAIRILPPYWAALAIAAAATALLSLLGAPLSPVEAAARERLSEAAPIRWAQVATLTAGLQRTGELPWYKYQLANLAFWTLAIEVQFYAVMWFAVWSGRWFYPVLLGVTLLSLPFCLSGLAFRSGSFLACWPSFALGVGLLAARERGWELRSKLPRTMITLCALCAIVAGLVIAPLDPDGGRAMLGGELLFAAGLTSALWAVGRSTADQPAGATLDYLGTVSYSVYLLHVPLMYLIAHAIAVIIPPSSPAFTALTAVLICALAYPFYWFVERPCLSGAWVGSSAASRS